MCLQSLLSWMAEEEDGATTDVEETRSMIPENLMWSILVRFFYYQFVTIIEYVYNVFFHISIILTINRRIFSFIQIKICFIMCLQDTDAIRKKQTVENN